jgi:chemosensory pili system protein ChpA (sensor histidine kinase/response regulator)
MFFCRKEESARLVFSAPVIGSLEAPKTSERPKKILIIDDDPVILLALSNALKSGGYQVITAGDGGEAISQVREERPDMLLVDVCLPLDMTGCGALGWDGFQIARWIRNLNHKAPAIMMSSTDKPEYRQKATDAGARGFLTKPISKTLLLAAIATVFGHQRASGAVN